MTAVATSIAASAGSPGQAAPGLASLSLSRLTLTDFRNYTALRLDVDSRPVVLTGPNGAGKTNLIEAISLLNPGRGLRRAVMADVTRQGAAGGFGIAARLETPTGDLDLGTGIQPATATEAERRLVRVNGANASGPSVLAEHLSLVWLTPAMDRLFVEAASERRRFLDRLVHGVDPGHARRVTAYEKAMRDRSRLLREGRNDARWLSALEETMAGHGIAIAAARRDLIARLDAALALGSTAFPTADLTIDGLLEAWLADASAVEVEDRFREKLAANRGRDAEAGAATSGPHKSDLQARHVQRDMPAALCSTGEQKALLIAIVLANAKIIAARRAQAPLLLLDELVAHLDRVRRQALFDEIAALRAQSWMTGTDQSLFDDWGDRAQFLAVLGGEVVVDRKP